MDRKLATVLSDLGLTATESAIYVALLQRCQDGPITAYKLAQDLGKDPANLTKALAGMVKRGAVTASGRRPRTYLPAEPREFIGSLVANLRERQTQAVAMLERIGTPPDDGRPHALETRDAALEAASALLTDATRLVLVSAAPEWLAVLEPDLDRAATTGGAVVLTRSTAAGPIPGPWLRLAVDGSTALVALGRPDDDRLLHGHWSRNRAEAFLLHHDLLQGAVLGDVLDLLQAGTAGEAVRRRADEQWLLMSKPVPWREHWHGLSLPDYEPASPAAEEMDPAAVATTMAELEAEFTPETPGRPQKDTRPQSPPAATARAGGVDGETASDGPLQFIFRRKRNRS